MNATTSAEVLANISKRRAAVDAASLALRSVLAADAGPWTPTMLQQKASTNGDFSAKALRSAMLSMQCEGELVRSENFTVTFVHSASQQ